MSGLTNRTEKKSGGSMMWGQTPINLDVEEASNQGFAGDAAAPSASTPLIGAATDTGVDPRLDPTAALRKAGLPVTAIDLTGGVALENLLLREVGPEQQRWGSMIGWVRLLLALLYAITGLTFLFVIIFVPAHGKMPMYFDPIKFSALDNKWEVANEQIGTVDVAWALLALMTSFAVYHAVHFLPFVRDIWLRLVFWYRMNPIRWVFHGVVGGLMVAFFSLILGVSNIIVFILLLVITIGAAACVLFSEMINRPVVHWVEADDTVSSLQSTYGLTDLQAERAIKTNKFFLVKGAVTPWPLLAAWVLFLAGVGIVGAYFFSAVDDKAAHVPWYAWTTLFTVAVPLLLMAIVNTLATLLDWSIFSNYFYIDMIHVPVELIFAWLGTVLVLIGLATLA